MYKRFTLNVNGNILLRRIILKLFLRNGMRQCGLDLPDSKQGRVMGFLKAAVNFPVL
jgi:hypothetical protein